MPNDKRPPNPWWNTCVNVNNENICGAIWQGIRPKVKERIRKNKEGFEG